LKYFGSTGEPWTPDAWWWLFGRAGHGRIPVMNYSGGTEIAGDSVQQPAAADYPVRVLGALFGDGGGCGE